jgi:ribosomal-protein-alanine N-acetyltransferase
VLISSQDMSLSFPHPYNLEHAEFWVKKCLEEKLPSYAIAEPDHPEIVIGSIGLKPGIDIKAHTAEVGYWIGEPWWGKG